MQSAAKAAQLITDILQMSVTESFTTSIIWLCNECVSASHTNLYTEFLSDSLKLISKHAIADNLKVCQYEFKSRSIFHVSVKN